jgi:hypothetical protein
VRDAATGEDPLLQPELTVLAEDTLASLASMTSRTASGLRALESGEQRPVVGLPAVEELGRQELDAELLERGVIGRAAPRPKSSFMGDDRRRLDLLADVLRERVGHDGVVDVDAELPLVAPDADISRIFGLRARLGDLRDLELLMMGMAPRQAPLCVWPMITSTLSTSAAS